MISALSGFIKKILKIIYATGCGTNAILLYG